MSYDVASDIQAQMKFTLPELFENMQIDLYYMKNNYKKHKDDPI